jgi:hypothetical protein
MTPLAIETWLLCAKPRREYVLDAKLAAELLRDGFLCRFEAHDGVRWLEAVIPNASAKAALPMPDVPEPERHEPMPVVELIDGVDIDAVHFKRGAVRETASAGA